MNTWGSDFIRIMYHEISLNVYETLQIDAAISVGVSRKCSPLQNVSATSWAYGEHMVETLNGTLFEFNFSVSNGVLKLSSVPEMWNHSTSTNPWIMRGSLVGFNNLFSGRFYEKYNGGIVYCGPEYPEVENSTLHISMRPISFYGSVEAIATSITIPLLPPSKILYLKAFTEYEEINEGQRFGISNILRK